MRSKTASKLSPAAQALEDEVERRKAQAALNPQPEPPQPKPPGPLKAAVQALVGRTRPLTEADELKFKVEIDLQRAKYDAELEQRRLEARLSVVPELYREEFVLDRVDPEVDRTEVAKVLAWQYGSMGLWVVGPTGHSKSRAVGALLTRLVTKDKRRIKYLSGVQFANFCTEAFYDAAHTDQKMRTLVDPEILVIDDLAKRWTKSTQEGAFDIFERRSQRRRPIIVTINYTGDQLRARADDPENLVAPLLRRVRDFCHLAVF